MLKVYINHITKAGGMLAATMTVRLLADLELGLLLTRGGSRT